MPVSYTNRKGVTYTLYRGQTKSGKPRYYFGLGHGPGEPVTEIPPGFIIKEGVNGVVSLAKDRPSLIEPEEVAAVEGAMKQHPEARRYRIAVKHKYIEIYEQFGPSYDTLLSEMEKMTGRSYSGEASWFRSYEESHAQYTPVFRFTLLDPKQREFGVKRMCYRGSIDGWLELHQTGPVAELARTLIPTLGTDEFFELW